MNKLEKRISIKILEILGFNIHKVTYCQLIDYIEEAIKKRKFFKFILINPFLLLEARRLDDYYQYINECDIVAPDGFGILLAGKLFSFHFPERVTGTDLLPKLVKKSVEKKWRIFFLGSKPGVAKEAYNNFKNIYPDFELAGYHHGYFSKNEEEMVVNKIKTKNVDILMVCLGAYKQELFIKKYQKIIGVPVAFGNGAALDFWSKRVERAPEWMQNIGLEWSYRLIQEPGRLWRRYLIGNIIFLWLVLKEFLKIKVFKKD